MTPPRSHLGWHVACHTSVCEGKRCQLLRPCSLPVEPLNPRHCPPVCPHSSRVQVPRGPSAARLPLPRAWLLCVLLAEGPHQCAQVSLVLPPPPCPPGAGWPSAPPSPVTLVGVAGGGTGSCCWEGSQGAREFMLVLVVFSRLCRMDVSSFLQSVATSSAASASAIPSKTRTPARPAGKRSPTNATTPFIYEVLRATRE